MGFQPPLPVANVLEEIHKARFVLPAIQREFIWDTNQIRLLFDSLLRGYPIGSFLFWKVEPERSSQFNFYGFVKDYHEKNSPYAPAIAIPPGSDIVAILDGQQRLTSLNIGLYGSHAERQPRKWAANADAYPRKRLYLNLVQEGPDDELGLEYDFRFLTEKEAKEGEGKPNPWYRVSEVLTLADSGPAIMSALETQQLEGQTPFKRLYELFRAVRDQPSVNYYLEESQDADKVLDIFVRVNSAGTPLSYSDLLLSMATNQWEERDAREEVRSLISVLNGGAPPFRFSQDVVLKAGLALIDAPNIGFKVSNFTKQNTSLMEKRWGEIRQALIIAKDLLASFGFSGRTLGGHSVLIPISYYAFTRGLADNYVTSSNSASDREAMRSWIVRSQMKRGIWGSGLDTLLTRLREAIRNEGQTKFPVEALEAAMAPLGKSLRFDEAEIEELCELRYGRTRTFAALALLYPGLDLTKSFHEDHIFPRSVFTRKRLKEKGAPLTSIQAFIERADTLPNLQLLAGVPNAEKQAKTPSEWLNGPHFPSETVREHYTADNDLDGLPLEFVDFLEFHEGRRQRIHARLVSLLGARGAVQGAAEVIDVAQPVEQMGDQTEEVGPRDVGTSRESKSGHFMRFWESFRPLLEQQYPGWIGRKATSRRHYLALRSGRGGFSYAAGFRPDGRLRVQLYISFRDEKRTAEAYRRIETHRDEIERRFGASLAWEPLPGKKASRIAFYSPDLVSIEEEDKWSEVRSWFLENLGRFREAIQPVVDEVLTA